VPLADFLDACQAIGDEALTLGADTSFISRLRAFVREVVSLYESTLHEANRQLQERESTWQAIARNVTEGIFITTVEEGRILWVNEAFARMMGYTIDDLVGKTWMDLTPPDLLKEELAGKFEKEKQEEIPRYEKSFLHKDGSQIPILISYQAIDGKAFDRATVFLVVAVDISKQKAQEEALLAERNYWLEIFASLSEGAIIFDQDNRIHEINTAVSRMFGYMEEEMRGPSFTLSAKLVAPADQNLVKNKVQEALQTRESVSFEVSHRHKDGHWIPVLLSFKKLTKKAGWPSDRILATLVDLTEVKKQEEVLQDVVDYARQLIERLEKGVIFEDEGEAKGLAKAVQTHYNRAIASLKTLLERAQKTAIAVTLAAEQLMQGQQSLSRRVESEAASLEEIAASLEELSSSIQQTHDHVHSLADFAKNMAEQADKGQANMQKMASDMNAMREQADTMQEIIGVVEDIAFQTNLLSLNASVEAARAGRHGSGFAVIAEEIRRLANKTSGEVKTIRGWLKNLVRQSEESAESAAFNAKEVQTIAAMAKDVSQHVDSVSTVIGDFTQAMRQIQDTSGQLETHVQQNSAMAEEVSSAAEHLKREAEQMHAALRFFHTGKENNANASVPTRQDLSKPQPQKSANSLKRSAVTPPKDEWEVF
jgi:methyl-accepting chemotaxis protein